MRLPSVGEKLQVTGLAGIELLSQPAKWDIAFWDHAVFVGEVDIHLIEAIRSILFPNLVVGEIAGEPDQDRLSAVRSFDGPLFTINDGRRP